jgi:hypothetical protein
MYGAGDLGQTFYFMSDAKRRETPENTPICIFTKNVV